MKQKLILIEPETPRRRRPKPLRLRDDRVEIVGPKNVRAGDTLVLQALENVDGLKVAVGFNPEGVAALALAADSKNAEITHFEFDKYRLNRAQSNFAYCPELEIRSVIVADLYELGTDFDIIALPFGPDTGKQLARELIEQARGCLKVGGQLYVTNTAGSDDWLRKALKRSFGHSGTRLFDRRRKGSIWKIKRKSKDELAPVRHNQVFQVSLRGVDLEMETRPGTFSYGRLDMGTLSLMELVTSHGQQRTLDLGCGYGALGLFVAKLNQEGHVDLVDCYKRSVQSSLDNAKRNSIDNCEVLLRTDLEDIPGQYDCVVANPPYFSNMRIAESFIASAARQLKPNGRLLLVAKAIDKHTEVVGKYFRHCETRSRRSYGLAIAWNNGRPPELDVELSKVHSAETAD